MPACSAIASRMLASAVASIPPAGSGQIDISTSNVGVGTGGAPGSGGGEGEGGGGDGSGGDGGGGDGGGGKGGALAAHSASSLQHAAGKMPSLQVPLSPPAQGRSKTPNSMHVNVISLVVARPASMARAAQRSGSGTARMVRCGYGANREPVP